VTERESARERERERERERDLERDDYLYKTAAVAQGGCGDKSCHLFVTLSY